MLKERVEFIKNVVYAMDLVALTALYFFMHYFFGHARAMYHLDLIRQANVIPQPDSLDLYFRGYWLALVIWAVLLRKRGEQQRLRFQTYRRIIGRHLYDGVLFFITFSSAAFNALRPAASSALRFPLPLASHRSTRGSPPLGTSTNSFAFRRSLMGSALTT